MNVATGLPFSKMFSFFKEKCLLVAASVPSMVNNNSVTSTTGADDFFFITYTINDLKHKII
jgi:hypothetical protein